MIQELVRARYADISGCYRQGLDQNPKLHGRLVFQFVIQPDGSVRTAEITSREEFGDPAVAACALGVFRSLRFPQTTSRDDTANPTVTVVYPLCFVPDDSFQCDAETSEDQTIRAPDAEQEGS